MPKKPNRADVQAALDKLYTLQRHELLAICDYLMIARPTYKASRLELVEMIENHIAKLRERGLL